ncbi:MAG TPA: hypothetical protein VJJ52_06910 [Candidatus Nanoarchaeia archaeon]|nr:hypothetical protein [Candidatus Nanoarchaeia archaeon]
MGGVLSGLVKVGTTERLDVLSGLASRDMLVECLQEMGNFFGEPVNHGLLHFRDISEQSGINQTDMVIFPDSRTGKGDWYESDFYANRDLFQKIGMYFSGVKHSDHNPPYFALTNSNGLDRVREAFASRGFDVEEVPSLQNT